MRCALAIALVATAGCGGGSSTANDLSTIDLTIPACVGAPTSAVACDPSDSDVCFPDDSHYCFCAGSQWSCCDDVVPTCPSTPGTAGAFCCPGQPNGPDSSELDCPYACANGHRTVCSCADDFVWRCNPEPCSDAGP